MACRPPTSKLLQALGTEKSRPAMPPIQNPIVYTSETARIAKRKESEVVMRTKVKEAPPEPTTPPRSQGDLERAKHAALACQAYTSTFMPASAAPPPAHGIKPKGAATSAFDAAVAAAAASTETTILKDSVAQVIKIRTQLPSRAKKAEEQLSAAAQQAMLTRIMGKEPECVKKYASSPVMTVTPEVVEATAVGSEKSTKKGEWVQADVHLWTVEMRTQLETEFPNLVRESEALAPLFDETIEAILKYYKDDTQVASVLQKMVARRDVVDPDMKRLVPTGLLVKVWNEYVVKVDEPECYKLFRDNIIDMGGTCIQGDTHRLFSILVALDRAPKDKCVVEAAPAPVVIEKEEEEEEDIVMVTPKKKEEDVDVILVPSPTIEDEDEEVTTLEKTKDEEAFE